ncbi:MAG TPA: hypothetical protein VL283_05275 [Candidatus Baltobacteraceae bacterium]|nr:hypothetical protein [Candidatus Baltobacteraceae bacterium]
MTFNYMAFPMPAFDTDGYRPAVGDIVRVRTFAGSGMIAEVIADRRDGYLLKYHSSDGLSALYKVVPHWVGFTRVEKTLVRLAAARFRASGPPTAARIAAFETAWGAGALRALLTLTP